MTTLANTLALFGMALIRFGGRGGGGFAFMLFGLVIVGVVVWALARPYEAPRSSGRPGGSSPAPGAQE
jgi:predicted lipid-binding transport protein (Tim44 family)